MAASNRSAGGRKHGKKTRSGRTTARGQDKALMALLIGAMAANDHVAPDEAERAHHLIWFTRRFRNRSGDSVGRIIEDARSLLDRSDRLAVITKAARAIPPGLRPSAFALLVDLLLADGTLDVSERRFLRKVGSDLGIDPEFARTVLDVIRLKNRL